MSQPDLCVTSERAQKREDFTFTAPCLFIPMFADAFMRGVFERRGFGSLSLFFSNGGNVDQP